MGPKAVDANQVQKLDAEVVEPAQAGHASESVLSRAATDIQRLWRGKAGREAAEAE